MLDGRRTPEAGRTDRGRATWHDGAAQVTCDGDGAVIVIGRLLLVILPVAGLALGGVIGRPGGARWGAPAGLAVALLACGFTAYRWR